MYCDPFLLKVVLDVYNMQLSNRPAEALATRLVETSNGAFEMVGYASGGQDSPLTIPTHTDTDKVILFYRHRGDGGRYQNRPAGEHPYLITLT